MQQNLDSVKIPRLKMPEIHGKSGKQVIELMHLPRVDPEHNEQKGSDNVQQQEQVHI